MSDIAVLASCIMDLSFEVQDFPREGETVSCDNFHTGFGGKGANQAVAAAKSGADVRVFGGVGADQYGEDTIENFNEFGIDAGGIYRFERVGTGLASIYVNNAGENEIVIASRANEKLKVTDLDKLPEDWFDVDYLAGVLELPDKILLEAFERGSSAGSVVVLNGAPSREIPGKLLEFVDCFIVNETEAEFFSEISATGGDYSQQLAKLTELGPERIIMTLGAEGALIYENGVAEKINAESREVIDTTGAGDAFIGRYLSASAAGDSPVEAVKKANSYAADSVTAPGTQKSFPEL